MFQSYLKKYYFVFNWKNNKSCYGDIYIYIYLNCHFYNLNRKLNFFKKLEFYKKKILVDLMIVNEDLSSDVTFKLDRCFCFSKKER